MRHIVLILLVLGLLGVIGIMIFDPTGKQAGPATTTATNEPPAPPPDTSLAPPETIEFDNTYGKSVFTHKMHIDRVNGDCSTCHPKIFPQSREPINYKKALHRSAEADATACAACHRVGGTSFAADSNCTKCHEVKK